MNSDLYDFEKICRFCLTFYDYPDPEKLFSISSDMPSLPLIIEEFTSLKCYQNDGLPKNICYECKQTFIQMTQFKQICINSDKILTNQLQLISMNNDDSNELIEIIEITDVIPLKQHKVYGKERKKQNTSKLEIKSEIIDEKLNRHDSVNVETTYIDSNIQNADTKINFEFDNNLLPIVVDEDISLFDLEAIDTTMIDLSDIKENTDEEILFAVEIINETDDQILEPIEKFIENNMEDHNSTDNAIETEEIKLETDKQENDKQENDKQENYKQKDVKQKDVKQKNVKQEDVKQKNVKHKTVKQVKQGTIKKGTVKQGTVKQRTAKRESKNGKHYTPTPRQPCHVCGKFYESNKLKYHMNMHNNLKPFVCDYENCNSKFPSPFALTKHKKFIHAKIPQFECDICHKRFKVKTTLTRHKTYHGEPQIPCEFCGKMVRNSRALKLHKMCHSGERPHQCETCGKKFQTRYTLRIHKRVHTKEKPYGCHKCSESFAYNCLLQAHLKKKHNMCS